MNISGVGFAPYLYNVNSVSANSMNRIAPVSDDVTRSRVDFSGLVSDSSEVQNPLRRGESSNFADILASQMALGAFQRDKLSVPAMQPVEVAQTINNTINASDASATELMESSSDHRMQRAIDAYSQTMDLYS